MKKILSVECGDFLIEYSFLYPETKLYFEKYLKWMPETGKGCSISVSEKYIKDNLWVVNEKEDSPPYLEFQSLMLATGNTLLSYDRALFHGVALLWKGKAWIFTAPSGTGKTTQLLHWRKKLKREVKTINGDKPFLECRNDGSVWVYSSPWRGKEKYGRRGLSAPLGGIILLEQGNENQIMRMKPEEVVIPLFTEFISFPETVRQIKSQAEILDQILDCVPVWKLINLGDENSAELTIKTLNEYLETER